MKQNIRVAIFHNFMDNIGGAEMVGLTLARELNADLVSTNFDTEKINKMGFSDIKLRSIGKVPKNAPFRQQIAMLRFRFLNLQKEYDFFIIDGDWAMSGAVNHHPNIWYVHSPIREIWDLKDYVRNNVVPFGFRHIYDLWAHLNRFLNKRYIKEVNTILCNSQNTSQRVKKYLDLKAEVLHPPVDTSRFSNKSNSGYWLSVNRLIGHKRIDIQLEAFKNLTEERLIIVGSYEQSKHFLEYANYIKKNCPKNVEIKSWVGEEELIELYANCKGFITTAQDEDFGLTAVEAMACGKPVIAPYEGGYKESVIHMKTGYLFTDISSRGLEKAVHTVGEELVSHCANDCVRQAFKFDTGRFIARIREIMEQQL